MMIYAIIYQINPSCQMVFKIKACVNITLIEFISGVFLINFFLDFNILIYILNITFWLLTLS